MLEQLRFGPPRPQGPMNQKQLEPAVLRRGEQFRDQLLDVVPGQAGLKLLEQDAASSEIHRPPVVGIHQTQVP